MKKYIIIAITMMFGISVNRAQASCSNEEIARLKKEAAKVKMVYEEATGVLTTGRIPELGDQIYEAKYNYFKIIVSNITKELYVVITNDKTTENLQIEYSDTENGVYTFDLKNIDEMVNYDMEVRVNNEECFGEKLSSGYLKTPRYNFLHDTTLCEGITDLSACDKYIIENAEQSVLEERIKEYKERKKEEEEPKKSIFQKIITFIVDHKIIIGGIVVTIGAGVALGEYKKRKRAK